MNIEIITPDSKLFKGEIKSVTVPGTKGTFMVLKNHAPIISTLGKGKIILMTDASIEKDFEIESGLIEVKRNKIVILAETV
jgi:F-type H+-transporting ATPase subunit epsilon